MTVGEFVDLLFHPHEDDWPEQPEWTVEELEAMKADIDAERARRVDEAGE